MGKHYELRDGQVRMAARVLHALSAGEHLLVEAGTGTGKSLAYLLPAALWGVAQQQRVVIATNTIALQDQLLHKDLPQVQRILTQSGLAPPNVALLKGRSHYICMRRFHSWRTSHRLTAAEVSLLAKLLVWLSGSTSGDVSELLLVTPAERAIWQRLCSDSVLCSPARCGEEIGRDANGLPTGDFFFHAHRQAENAQLLVVNHALLMADLAAGGHILPPYDDLIIDEAHHLEDVTTEQLTQRVDWRAMQALLRRLAAEHGLLAGILHEAALRQWLEVPGVIQAITSANALTRRELDDFAARLLAVASALDSVRPNVGYVQRVALDSRLRAQPVWSQLEIEWEQASAAFSALVDNLGVLVELLERAQWWQEDPTALLFGELRALYDNLRTALDQLDRVIFAAKPQTGLVTWLEISEKGEAVTVAIAPLHINTVIDEGLVQSKRSVVFTSATLRTHTGFDFIRERLGLWDLAAATVESPFNYAENTLLLLPANLPMPNQAAYQQAVERAITDAALAADGRTMALFTSYAHLRTTAEAIRAPLDRAGITLLEHSGVSRSRLLREFRQTDRAVLLGTRSFWEGVDLPGDELSCLLIIRLPFAVPSDPLVAARTADLENAFREYTLPEAILRFRQGFGRLIRRATDRGVVVILDSRVWQRDYGRAFLDALPTCTLQRTPLYNLGEEIRKWLG